MGTREIELALRRKLIGLQLQTARLEAGLDAATCASWVNVSPEELEAWESGQRPVPFSALVRLARRLDLPLAVFEDSTPLSPAETSTFTQTVGTHLKAFRERAGISIEDLAARAGIAPEDLAAAEAGTLDLEAAVLVTLGRELGFSLEDVTRPVTHKPVPDIPDDLAEWLAVKDHQQLVRQLQALLDQPVEALTALGGLILDAAMLVTNREQTSQ